MHRRAVEIVAASILLLVGAAFVTGARQLGIATLSEPGPGMLPALAGGSLSVLATLHIVALVRSFDGGAAPVEIGRTPAIKIAATVAAALAVPIAAPHVGFLVSSAAMLFVLFHLVARLALAPAVAVTFGVAGINYIVFAVLLKVPLP